MTSKALHRTPKQLLQPQATALQINANAVVINGTDARNGLTFATR